MAASSTTVLDDLERQRLELEDNIRKLQESLYHWRLWEAEYDGLKEEVDFLADYASREDYLQAARDCGGVLVNEEEVKVLLGDKQGVSRTRQQIINVILRRIDYVRQNASTIEKRLRDAEDKLDALAGELGLDIDRERKRASTATEAEEEFPVTEIVEQLDKEGRVISGTTMTPGSQAPELLEILKKVGIEDIPDVPNKEQKKAVAQPKEVEDGAKAQETETAQPAEIEGDTDRALRSEEEKQRRTGASEPQECDVKGGQTTLDSEKTDITLPEHLGNHTSIAREQSEENKELPVTEVDESPEDAKLRREMLQYGLNEVGAVVAELELDEDASDITISDEEGSYGYDSEDYDEEDEFGRSTRSVLSEEYRQQMRELEEKLNARGLWNAGKDTRSLPDDVRYELERPHTAKVEEPLEENTTENTISEKKPKRVAFAEELDIAPATKPPSSPSQTKKLPPRQPDIPVLSDSIIERTSQAEQPSRVQPKAPKKVSRFKSARNDTAPVAAATAASSSSSRPSQRHYAVHRHEPSSYPLSLFPAKPKEPKPFSQPITDICEQMPRHSSPQPPQDKILADKLFEREVSQGTAVPPEPDELDEQLHRKEIATEFYRMRNRMIQQQGGFVDDEEPETMPVETDEPVKRVRIPGNMIMHYHIVIITAKISKIKDRQGYLAASLALHPVCTVLALSSWVPTYK
ncbi:hypothetical protein MAP00_008872 [Monascus purpureus]|nr:hypothetical protein MAP00_008872 [Monascus purpureus]